MSGPRFTARIGDRGPWRGARRGPRSAFSAVRAIAASLAALAAGCASAGRPAPEPEVGCYQIQRDAGARALGLPWGFVLEDAPLEPGWPVLARSPYARRALTATSATTRQDHPFGYWARTPGDSIEVGYPAGGGGFLLRLAPSGQDLAGLGRPIGDATAPGALSDTPSAATVTARRVLCGAP